MQVPVFAALADRTRLGLVARLSRGQSCSIAELTQDSRLTRQAISKHLRVLEQAGIVHGMRRGRENVFAFNAEPIEKSINYLAEISAQWDQALSRLKAFVEEDDDDDDDES